MDVLSFDEFLPADLGERTRVESANGRVPFVILRPDRGEASPPQPIAVVFAACVPRVGETLRWENGEIYAVIAVTHRLTTDVTAPPYLIALPLLSTRPVS